MLVPLTHVLQESSPAAAGSFNILDLNLALAILNEAEAQQTPGVLRSSKWHYDSIRTPSILPSLTTVIEGLKIPVALYLDHAEPTQMDVICDATHVDELAIAAGTALGLNKQPLQLSFETIGQIHKTIFTSLVWHGATGVSDEDIKGAVHCGIGKINYFSWLLKSAMGGTQSVNIDYGNDSLKFIQELNFNWRDVVSRQIKLYALQSI